MSDSFAATFKTGPISQLLTPCLLLDEIKLRRNLDRLDERLAGLGVTLRPHLKTAKSVDVARLAVPHRKAPATVSTLMEAEYFAAEGMHDLLYAVGIAPAKLDRVGAIRRRYKAALSIILDSVEQAEAVTEWCRRSGDKLPVFIEIDCDGHRSGVQPGETERLVAIGRILHEGGAILRGVMTHAGESYNLNDPKALTAAAETERAGAVSAAEALRAAGLPCPVVSVGSTPTAHFARNLEGVTEVRAGVYMFSDLVQAGIGVCGVEDIALSVLATVIGHQRSKGWIIVDAGWMAMSRDRGTASQTVDQGYGVVCDLAGTPYPDLIMPGANQEHGVLALRPGSNAALPDLKLGDKVRILPNHACATGAQHDRYHVVHGAEADVKAIWPRINGW
ncbi:DSD1 family PLP-dependent enzyme [Radicibacter daui]|uniref:DSD1 family PLP-dependent enzyme n=1 Tax=Radicibacter daui TaxID=3064829 RepID=UPI004046DEBA